MRTGKLIRLLENILEDLQEKENLREEIGQVREQFEIQANYLKGQAKADQSTIGNFRAERDAALADVAKLKEFTTVARDQFAQWKRRGDEAEASLSEAAKKIANLERAREEAFEAGKEAVFQECEQLRERLVALESAIHATRTEVAMWKERAEEWETEAKGGPCASRIRLTESPTAITVCCAVSSLPLISRLEPIAVAIDERKEKTQEIPPMFCAICGKEITDGYHFTTDMNGARRYLRHEDCRADQEGSKLITERVPSGQIVAAGGG